VVAGVGDVNKSVVRGMLKASGWILAIHITQIEETPGFFPATNSPGYLASSFLRSGMGESSRVTEKETKEEKTGGF
jgi:hypothetical protein